MTSFLDWIDVEVECKNIDKISPIARGGTSGIKIKLREVDVSSIISSLCETFGEDKVIDYIKSS